jgi:archaellum component FlaC
MEAAMHYGRVPAVGVLALALAGAGACAREEAPDTAAADATDPAVERAAELERERNDAIARMRDRVSELERDYQERITAKPRGTSGASAGLREEVQEDVKNVTAAVDDLRTTNADNWWDRHEEAVKRTADDIEADVRRLAGARALPATPKEPAEGNAEAASSAPFMSRRDRLVKDVRGRVDSWEKALENVNARGARETELDDLRARMNKLDEDLDRLGKASADDWWDVTQARVNDYIDRVEKSVARLDDDRPGNTTAR